MNAENENIALRNKITELRERLNQIYSQSALEANRSKAFESEFSLYVKACEHARSERTEGIRLQHDVTKFGLILTTLFLASTVYLFSLDTLLGMFILLGSAFVLCGLLYLLLAGEIRITRAGDYCNELEAYFRRHRWSAEQQSTLHLSEIPLWEEYRGRWGKDLSDEGRYGKTAVYLPLRTAMTVTDLFALGYILHSVIAHRSETSPVALILGGITWVAAVTVQMLLVNAIMRGPETEREGVKGNQEKRISRQPATWITIPRLFFLADIMFPGEGSRKK
ncbi:MAG TPA: hypothetical protein VFG09_01170 [Thermodesulfovibrionales bacterium]|nr:hypothetical protein [Thermodesulfovibrionales bacterium]